MSIAAFLLLVGVAQGRRLGPYDDDATLHPIASKSQSRRICAALCVSGLGGERCGDNCLDISPQQFPLKIQNETDAYQRYGLNTRNDACPLLCENHLGYPLCDCKDKQTEKNSDVDYVAICGYFCVKHNFRIDGCQKCDVYQKHEDAQLLFRIIKPKVIKNIKDNINWEEWCRDRCSVGDGGIACNCDILPFMAPAVSVPA